MAMEPYMGACFPQDSCFCNGNMVRNADGICNERTDCPGTYDWSVRETASGKAIDK